ncbi:MAG: hypothetical protein JWM09_59 [Francisellaceae bacterium]|nr:hypothetical protein [Francisellaceae bacterium]
MVVLWISAMHLVIKLLISIILIYHFNQELRIKILRKHPKSIIHFWITENNEIGVKTLQQSMLKGKLNSESFVSPYLIILRIKSRYLSKTIILFKDTLTNFEYTRILERLLVCQ